MQNNIFDIVIETERLVLRKLCLSDVKDMYDYTSNPQVTKYLHWSAHTDISLTRKFIEDTLVKYESVNTEYTYGIQLKSTTKLIGVLKILNISYTNKRGEFTSILNPSYQGKGYMGEAWKGLLEFCFNSAGINRIQSYVTEDNKASINKNLRAGLLYEGRLKDWWIIKGEYKDALVYAITAGIFSKNNNIKNRNI